MLHLKKSRAYPALCSQRFNTNCNLRESEDHHEEISCFFEFEGGNDKEPDGHVLGVINCSCVGFNSHLESGIQEKVADEIIRVVSSKKSYKWFQKLCVFVVSFYFSWMIALLF